MNSKSIKMDNAEKALNAASDAQDRKRGCKSSIRRLRCLPKLVAWAKNTAQAAAEAAAKAKVNAEAAEAAEDAEATKKAQHEAALAANKAKAAEDRMKHCVELASNAPRLEDLESEYIDARRVDQQLRAKASKAWRGLVLSGIKFGDSICRTASKLGFPTEKKRIRKMRI